MANEYQVTLRGTVAGQSLQNVRYYRAGSLPGTDDIQAFADNLGELLESQYMNLLPTNVVYQDIYIRPNIPGALGASFVPNNWPLIGNQTGDPLGPSTTVNVRLRSGGIPMPNKGLVQLPSCSEAVQSAGLLIPGIMGTYNTASSLWSTTIIPTQGPQWTPLLYSTINGLYNTVTVTSTLQKLGRQSQRDYGNGN